VDLDTGNVSKGTLSFDVTASVQAWVDGATNYGWVMLERGNNRWSFRSSEWAGLVERPMLTVVHGNIPVVPAAGATARLVLVIGLVGCALARLPTPPPSRS
jgi:hypothetical protein